MKYARMGLILALLAAGIANRSAHGAIISRDFQSFGDGLLTFDRVNKREWFDVTATNPLNIPDIYDALSEGGQLHGFQIATVQDLRGLLASAGFVGTGQNGQHDFDIMSLLIDMLGESYEITTEFGQWCAGGPSPCAIVTHARMSDGLAITGTTPNAVIPFGIQATTRTTPAYWPGYPPHIDISQYGWADTYLDSPDGRVTYSPYRGIWLFREAPIPEPPALHHLVIASTLAFMAGRRRSGVCCRR